MSDQTKPPSQPVSGYAQEVRPDDRPPSCTICGKDMVRDGDSYRCQSCGNMTGLSQLASAMSAAEFYRQQGYKGELSPFWIPFAEAYAARELAIVRAECDRLKQRYAKLVKAISVAECLPECDAYGHDEKCPNASTAKLLVRLRSALSECYIDLAALLNATTWELAPAVREQLQKSHDIAGDALKAERS